MRYTPSKKLNVHKYFFSIPWEQWSILNFLNWMKKQEILAEDSRRVLHSVYRNGLTLILESDPPESVQMRIRVLMKRDFKTNETALRLFWSEVQRSTRLAEAQAEMRHNLLLEKERREYEEDMLQNRKKRLESEESWAKRPSSKRAITDDTANSTEYSTKIEVESDCDSYFSDTLYYVLESGRDVMYIMQKAYCSSPEDSYLALGILDLSHSTPLHGFTNIEWAQMQSDLAKTLRLIDLEIDKRYKNAVDFLCKDSLTLTLKQVDKGFKEMMRAIKEPYDSEIIDGLRDVHAAVNGIVRKFNRGQNISSTISEGTFMIRFFAQLIEDLFGDLIEDLVDIEWGEKALLASSTRRNESLVEGERAHMGQKTDMIGSLRSKRWEFLLGEVTAPGEKAKSMKARTDRAKLVEGMKDALDQLLTDGLNGATSEEIREIFVLGLQVVDTRVSVYIMNLAHKGVYRLQRIDKFDIPRNKHDITTLKKAMRKFLKLKGYVRAVAERIENLYQDLSEQSSPPTMRTASNIMTQPTEPSHSFKDLYSKKENVRFKKRRKVN